MLRCVKMITTNTYRRRGLKRMELNKDNIRKIMIIIVVTLLLYFGLLHLDVVREYFGIFTKIMTPFIAGASLAFILNVPMRWIEKSIAGLLARRKKAKKPVSKGLLRVSSLLITLILFVGVIVAIVFLVVPELGRSITMIIDKYPAFSDRAQEAVTDLTVKYPAIKDYIMSYNINWDTIGQNVLNFTKMAGGSVLSSTIGVATSIVGVIFNSIIAFVFAVNILLQKEKLIVQSKRLFYAFLPEPAADKTLYVCTLSSNTFARFLSGQGRESLILGSMFLLAMIIFKFPYALLISILIAVLALIPMFGAFIGCCFGVFFILIVDPVKALWFLVLFIILQQIEGNIIYPRVVGGSIGLPSIWVLVAVTVGGSLYGVVGMLVFIPMASVIYVLIRETISKRLSEKMIAEEKIE